MDSKLSACQGALLGLAVGDAMGYTIDGKSWEEIENSYGPNGLLGYDLQNEYADITSHTQLAAFVCNGLLLSLTRGLSDGFHRYITLALRDWAKAQLTRGGTEKSFCWVGKIPSLRRRMCMDIRMLDALSRKTPGTPEKPITTSANAGCMTTAIAIGLFFGARSSEFSDLSALTVQSVALTHGDTETQLAGAFLAQTLSGLLQNPELTLPQQYGKALSKIKQQYDGRYPTAVNALAEKLQRAVSLTRDEEITPLVAMTLLGCTTASECLAGSVYASLIHPHNFDEGMIVAVNHSGRSAAVGAITGALLGAKLGANTLPEFYLESIESRSALEELSKDMILGRQSARIFDDRWDQKYVQGLIPG